MKRRKRKWPYGLILLILIVIGFLIYLKPSSNTKQDSGSCSYQPKTWSQFGEFRRFEMLLEGFAIKSMIDIPCVDQDWITRAVLGSIRYTGITNTKDQAQALQIQYGGKLRTFLGMDVTVDVLPAADLIVCWDSLCALSEREIKAALVQLKKSGSHFLLMRNYSQQKRNPKEKNSGYEPINWTIAPYHFPEPIITIIEEGSEANGCLALWNLDTI